MPTFQFDPRDLIGPPYRGCPKCGSESFGVLSISGQSYARRCRNCFHNASFPLWPLNKKVIYIDQFAISNMAKALNTAMRGHDRAAADPRWLNLFEALERVCKLQLAICPNSEGHFHESLLSGYFEPLRHMYEHLSHGISFDWWQQIAKSQLIVATTTWLRGERAVYDLNPELVTSRRLHDWQDRIRISVNMNYPPDMAEDIRRIRDELDGSLQAHFDSIRSAPQKDFEYWLTREREAVGNSLIESWRRYVERLKQMEELDFDRVYNSNGLEQVRLIIEIFERERVRPQERLGDFLKSDELKDTPSNRISCLMWAVLAHRAANGQIQAPNRGMVNDINMASTLLPYCDAMLIDKECRGILADIPKRHRPDHSAKVFSPNMMDEFVAYLREVEEQGDPIVLKQVHEVYGEDWPKPFLTIYEERGRRGAK
jgi:hypothetical protein